MIAALLNPLFVIAMQTQRPHQFEATPESLSNYKCPDWFRDAKFGIWAHWGPQSVPMMGDWYARNMYIQGSGQYEDHLKRYGHPSEHGYREIIDLWRAEKWDPDALMKLYKEAGAKYFVSMACHHDNFDLWNSKHHSWNAVIMGPKRDVLGEWQRAAKKYGLRFGASEHMGASYTWFQTSHGSDATGPKAGVPYDGTNPAFADLYHPPTDKDDHDWYSTNPAWHAEWLSRVTDLIDNYHPDLLYSDGGNPFGQTGRDMVAHFYNSNMQVHGGALEAVYNFKGGGTKEFLAGSGVDDLERGVMPRINPTPWQTDTSIGDWFYNKNWTYRGAGWVINTLVDVVSKNGNLLINVVQRPDGTIDPQVHTLLKDFGAWIKINGDAIYGTRPWIVFGEGPTRVRGGSFKEDFSFGPKDVRYTTKGNHTLYVTTLGVPRETTLDLAALGLAGSAKGLVKAVAMLGSKAAVKWVQDATGLHVTLPSDALKAKFAVSLKITCDDVFKFDANNIKPIAHVVTADAKGTLTLGAADAELTGEKLAEEEKDGIPNLGYWDNGDDAATWTVRVPRDGKYRIIAEVASVFDGANFKITFGSNSIDAALPNTTDWAKFQAVPLGTIDLADGTIKIKVGSVQASTWKAINLRSIKLVPDSP